MLFRETEDIDDGKIGERNLPKDLTTDLKSYRFFSFFLKRRVSFALPTRLSLVVPLHEIKQNAHLIAPWKYKRMERRIAHSYNLINHTKSVKLLDSLLSNANMNRNNIIDELLTNCMTLLQPNQSYVCY